jgi:hypothetical protein
MTRDRAVSDARVERVAALCQIQMPRSLARRTEWQFRDRYHAGMGSRRLSRPGRSADAVGSLGRSAHGEGK